MRKTVIILSVLALIAGSCGQATKKQVEAVNSETITEQNSEIITEQSNEEVEYQDIDVITTIKFSDFTLTINRLSVWNEKEELDKIQKDTVYLDIELGETIEGQLLFIETSELTNIKVEQRYETSITIMDEGPHCDLTNWKHYYSEWEQLKRNKAGQFVCEEYTQTDREKFPAIDIEELKKKVKTQCSQYGERWFELVKNIKAPTEYPSGVGI
ncbi:MAG: hypothetical protein LBU83_11190, partial [Bacteroidales bacterium]|nr:hypothetical protein [Bacteroidales bacterium]